jgi:hypothetical protein
MRLITKKNFKIGQKKKLCEMSQGLLLKVQERFLKHFMFKIFDGGLKGPKHEIFESGFFTQIRGLWLGDLGTGEKN